MGSCTVNLRSNRCATIAFFWFALNTCPALADTATVVERSSTAPRGLQLIDWGIIGLYAIATICLGVYYGRKQESTEEYFIGSGNMNPLIVGVSLFATHYLAPSLTFPSLVKQRAEDR